jgi:hypothetical protein
VPQTSSFYELAALLIPVLMFTGFATSRLRPPSIFDIEEHPLRSFVLTSVTVVLFGFLPASGELFALNSVMGGGTTGASFTWVIVAAMAVGIWSLAVTAIWPWIQPTFVRSTTKQKTFLVAASGVLLPVISAFALHSGVQLQTTRAATFELEDGLGATNDAKAQVLVDLYRVELDQLDASRREKAVTRADYLTQRFKISGQLVQALDNKAVSAP